MSSADFTLYKMFDKNEPIGNEFLNHHFGTQTASIINAINSTIPLPKGVRRPKPYHAKDFFPVREKATDQLTAEQAEHLRKKREKRKGKK
jgi:hypothetical protein